MVQFYRVEHHTIMSGLVVRYRPVGDTSDFEISASRDGVLIQGHSPHLNAMDAVRINSILERAIEVSQAIEQMGRRSSDFRPSWLEFGHDPSCVVELHKAHFAGEDEVIEKRGTVGS